MFDHEAFFPVLRQLDGILFRHGISYHLTGGLVSIYYSEPRLTTDADVVVDQRQLLSCLDAIIQDFAAHGYLFAEQVIRENAPRGRMFQLIDGKEMLKIDVYPRELADGQISRAVIVDFAEDLQFPVASRGDLIVAKLIWISKGSHKSRRDVKQLWRRATTEEIALVHRLAGEMSLMALLEEVLAEPDEIDA